MNTYLAAFLITIIAAAVVAGVLGYDAGFVEGRDQVLDVVAGEIQAAWNDCRVIGGNYIEVMQHPDGSIDIVCSIIERGE